MAFSESMKIYVNFRKKEVDVDVNSIAEVQREKLNHQESKVDGPATVEESPSTNITSNMEATEQPSSANEETSSATRLIIPSEDQTEESSHESEAESRNEEDTRDLHESVVLIERER